MPQKHETVYEYLTRTGKAMQTGKLSGAELYRRTAVNGAVSPESREVGEILVKTQTRFTAKFTGLARNIETFGDDLPRPLYQVTMKNEHGTFRTQYYDSVANSQMPYIVYNISKARLERISAVDYLRILNGDTGNNIGEYSRRLIFRNEPQPADVLKCVADCFRFLEYETWCERYNKDPDSLRVLDTYKGWLKTRRAIIKLFSDEAIRDRLSRLLDV